MVVRWAVLSDFSTLFLPFEREGKAMHNSDTVRGKDWFLSLKSMRAKTQQTRQTKLGE